jgi:hypothetical protein
VRDGTTSTIGTNHGHTLFVSKEDVAAGTAKTYDIRGTSSHPHTVTITREHFLQLQQDTTISTVSTSDAGHTHAVTVTCV